MSKTMACEAELTNKYLNLKAFNFEVPTDQVAQSPLAERDQSKFLIWDGHKVSHRQVFNLSDTIPNGTLFIVNDSRVIASRIHGKLKTGGAIEFLLLEPIGATAPSEIGESWLCLGKPMRKLPLGTIISFGDGLSATIARDSTPSNAGPEPFEARFNLCGENLLAWLEKNGEMPLPPYISRKNPSLDQQRFDRERYQTVYAGDLGSVAAPTAGLHFTEQVLASLKAKDCEVQYVTLHVGAGTFLPVKTEDPSQHKMHFERFLVPAKTLAAIRQAKAEGRKVVVVGTTALRSLEGLYALALSQNSTLEELAGKWLRTNIFIRPSFAGDRHKSWFADALMTNFHQPESTLFMLVCALAGYDQMHSLYKEAVHEGYRFYSYGDSSLLWL
jgi:S-adenosylmethionine:tRNA ribosyltransferase-isomerase